MVRNQVPETPIFVSAPHFQHRARINPVRLLAMPVQYETSNEACAVLRRPQVAPFPSLRPLRSALRALR